MDNIIIIVSLYYYFILKIKFYKHHFLCIIFFAISCILINLFAIIMYIDVNKNDFSFKIFFPKYILNFLQVSLYSLTYGLYKYFMESTYMRSFEILFFQGLIDIVLSFILIAILIKCEAIYSFHYYWEQIRERVASFIILIILNFGCFSHIFAIIDIFSPIYIFFSGVDLL